MIETDHQEDSVDQAVPMRMLTVQQSFRFERMVQSGQFASFDEAVDAHQHELQFVKCGKDTYSAEALQRLQEGMRQAASGRIRGWRSGDGKA